jgi:hypothetical protein
MGAPGVGALMQIAAVGPQNRHITSFSQKTSEYAPFLAVYKTHVPCAFEVREIRVDRDVRFGDKIRIVVPNDADFVGEMYLEIELPFINNFSGDGRFYWVDRIGYAMLKTARLLIDDEIVHSCDKYVHVTSDLLRTPPSKVAGKLEMVGGGFLPANTEHRLYVPLAFFSGRPRDGHGWLPTWALRNSVISVEIELETIFDLVLVQNAGVLEKPGNVDAFFLTEIVDPSVTAPNVKMVTVDGVSTNLEFRPLKIAHGNFSLLAQSAFVGHEARFFHMKADQLIEQVQTSESVNASESNVDAERYVDKYFADMPFVNNVKCLYWTVQKRSDMLANRYFDFLDAVETAAIHFDGGKTEIRRGSYYRTTEPYYSGLKTGSNVYCWSFALDADAHQPSGVAFLSNFSTKRARIELSQFGNVELVTRTFGASYNTLVSTGGKGRLAYS